MNLTFGHESGESLIVACNDNTVLPHFEFHLARVGHCGRCGYVLRRRDWDPERTKRWLYSTLHTYVLSQNMVIHP